MVPAMPSQKVRSPGIRLAAQYLAKNSGKNPAMTVVAKVEFAQS